MAYSTPLKLRLLIALAIVAFAPVAAIVVSTPMTLFHQTLFGVVGVGLLLVMGQLPWRWAKLTMMLLSVVVSTRYLYWRATETLVLDSVVEGVLGIGLLAAECYAWVILLLGFFQIAWPLERRIVPLPDDPATWPSVDVYVPTYNESLELVRDTVLAALNIDYPSDKLRVYILDDGKRPEFGAFASAAGVGYITRPDNAHAKAGNLNHAMHQTNGELICVFDCDHIATRAFLQATVGAFVADERLALLQTPHHFYSPDPFERNLATGKDVPHEGDLFYGPVQKGNDYWNAAFFCGSCAVMRRRALEKTQGFAVETVTEDAHTALKLQRKGWNTAFLGLPLAAGLATERLALHIGQRARWARGMTQIFRLDNPLLGRGLKLPQRLCYLNAMLHFQFALPRVVFLTAPLAYLLFGLNIIDSSPEMIAAYALPHLFYAIYTNSRLVGRARYTFWGEIYETVLAFHLIKPTLVTLLDPRRGKFNVTEKGGVLAEGFFDYDTTRPHLFVLALLLAGVLWGGIRLAWNEVYGLQPSVLLLNLVWASISALVLLAAIAVARETRQVRETVRLDVRLPTILHLASGHTLRSTTRNLSMGGLRVDNPGNVTLAEPIEHVEISLDDAVMFFPVTLVTADEKGLGFRFEELSVRQRQELVRVVMGRADAWLEEDEPAQDRPLHSLWRVVQAVFGLFFNQWRERRLMTGERLRSGPASAPGLLGGWRLRLVLAVMIGLGVAMVSTKGWSAAGNGETGEGAGAAAATALPPVSFASDGTLELAPLTATYTKAIDFAAMGLDAPLRIHGNGASAGLDYLLRQDEVVTDVSLTLDLRYSEALLGDASHLDVLLNGQPIETIVLDQFNAEGLIRRIAIEPALVLTYNTLEFRLVGQTTQQCSNLLSRDIWVELAPSSHLALTVQRLPYPNDLANFPAPFFDEGIVGALTLPIVLPASPTPASMLGGGIAASYFGALARFHGARFPVMQGRLPESDALVVATPESTIPGLVLPRIDGPALQLMDNPRSPLHKLLLVMGRDRAEIKAAVTYLTLGHERLQGHRVQVEVLSPAPRQPYDAPRWLDTQDPVALGEFADPEAFVAAGVFPGVNEISFRAAPDLFLWPGRNVPLHVEYQFPAGEWFDASRSNLDVSLNGHYLTSLAVERPGLLAALWQRLNGDIRQASAKVELPPYLLYGENRLQFYYNLSVVPGEDCLLALPGNITSRLSPQSRLDLSEAQHLAMLPDLSLFVGAGFPFSRLADLSQTVALLPEAPSEAEISALYGLLGRIGNATGYPVLELDMRLGLDADVTAPDRDLLVVGALDRLAESTLLSGTAFHVAQGQLSVDPATPFERVWQWLRGDWLRQDALAARAIEGRDDLQGLFSFPLADHRVAIVATASRDEQLPGMVAALDQPAISAGVHDDLALIDAQQGVRSFRVGAQVVSGDMPWHMQLRWFFGRHVILMIVAMSAIAMSGAAVLYLLLKNRAARRLADTVTDDA